MPYLTDYALEIEGTLPCDYEGIIATLYDLSDDAEIALTRSGGPNRPCRWYEHEDHLRQLSGRFPDLLIVLSGKGEDHDDVWTKYFKAGRMQECRVVMQMDPFDETKLV